jgi:hypothetical protein
MLLYNFLEPNKKITQQLEIELNDFQFTKRWKEYLIKTHNRLPDIDWLVGRANKPWMNTFEERLNIHLFRIYKAFLFFQHTLPYDFKEEINLIEYFVLNPDAIGQLHLNKWHRYFTTLAEIYLQENIKIPPNCTRDELYRNIHELNGHVHHLERFTFGKNKKRTKFGLDGQYAIHVPNKHNMSNVFNTVWAPGYVEYLDPGFFDFKNDNYNFDVWLHEDIQGKDLIRAWLDDDNINEEDVTGNIVMTPSILLDPSRIYQRVINDQQFRQDVAESHKTLDRAPLGNIKNINDINFELLITSKVTSITLDNKQLWSNSNLD